MTLLFLGDLAIPADQLIAGFRAQGYEGGAVAHQWVLPDNEAMVRANRWHELHGPDGLTDADALSGLIAPVREQIAGIVTQFFPVSRELIAQLPALRFIATVRSGTQNIDTEAAAERGIEIHRNPGRNAPAVADFTVALMLAACRGVAVASQSLAWGNWLPRSARAEFRTLSSTPVGLVGFGHVGRRVAELLRGFECPVRVYDPYLAEDLVKGLGVTRADSLDALMADSELVSLHARVTEELTGLIGHHELDLLGPDGILVNTARAELVDETALISALRNRSICAAALDVFSEEPLPAGHELLGLTNATLTPHLAGGSRDALPAAARLLARRLREALPPDLWTAAVPPGPGGHVPSIRPATGGQPSNQGGQTVSTDRHAPLPVRQFGRTGMSFTRVGLGTWAMGGLGPKMTWGSANDAESVATIRRAVDLGVNWIDTAAMYGHGHAEEVVGEAVGQIPEGNRPYISTKCGLRWGLADRTLRIGDPASLRWELDESLRRLKVDRIDLYFVHWPPEDGTPLEEYWATLVEMRRQGKIRTAGLSNHNLAQLQEAEAIGHVDALQPPFSAIERKAAQDLLPWCLAHETAVFNYAPMQSGLLTGTFSERRVSELPDNDWRKTHPNFTGQAFRRNLALAEAMRPVADKHATTVAAVAVAWTLEVPGTTSAIVGARRPEQVNSLVAAGTVELDHDDMTVIARAIEETGAGQGPACWPAQDGSGQTQPTADVR